MSGFDDLFAGLTRAELVPRYRMNLEAPFGERISFVVEAPTIATMAEWDTAQAQTVVAREAYIADNANEPAMLAASRDRERVVVDRIIEIRTGASRRPVTEADRDALHAMLSGRAELLMELQAMWVRLGTVDAEQGKD